MRKVLVLLLILLTSTLLSFQPAINVPQGKNPDINLWPRIPPIASYQIETTLNPEAKMLTGHEVITYTNTTADPIPDLVFHLYLNAFRDQNSIFLRESGQESRGYSWDPQRPGWIEVDSLLLIDGTPLTLEMIADGTLARAVLPAPILSGESVQVMVDFHAQLPKVFARTGYAGEKTGNDFFMVGQWYPKLGVWQDGAWNAYPFHANAEFYADFGTYNVKITLPANYVTGGIGLPISTVDNHDGTQSVTYHAEAVIDFSWTASPHFQSATRQVGGVEILYLCLPEHQWTVERVLKTAEASIKYYNQWFGPYIYPRLTVVDVPEDGAGAGGMEYPTLVTAGAMDIFGLGPSLSYLGIERSLEMLVSHEIAHQWWQSMVATNEAEEPWLDEGFSDYSALRLMETIYGKETSVMSVANLKLGYLEMRRAEYLSNPNLPMYGRAWDFPDLLDYEVAAYSKPVLSLDTLENILGEETMLKMMSTYFDRYRFAHPNTQDFRSVAEQVSGQDLAWFFDGLVYGRGVMDYSVTAVDEQSATVLRQGNLIIPTEVLITFADGSTRLEPWDGKQASMTFTYPDRPALLSAEVDPEHKLVVDLSWFDNGLARRLEVQSWLALVIRMFYQLQNALLGLGGL